MKWHRFQSLVRTLAYPWYNLTHDTSTPRVLVDHASAVQLLPNWTRWSVTSTAHVVVVVCLITSSEPSSPSSSASSETIHTAKSLCSSTRICPKQLSASIQLTVCVYNEMSSPWQFCIQCEILAMISSVTTTANCLTSLAGTLSPQTYTARRSYQFTVLTVTSHYASAKQRCPPTIIFLHQVVYCLQ